MKWNLRKIWPWLLGIFFLLWLYIAFYSKNGYEEILVQDGTGEFTASFDRVYNIIPIGEDVTQYDLIEGNNVSMTIQFTDEIDGTVLRVDLEDCSIHVNGYTSVDNIQTGDLPLELTVGHVYTVQYWALCGEQTVDHLSLALYGAEQSFRWLQIVVLILVGAGTACLFYVLRSGRHFIPAFLMLWCCLYVLYLLSAPLQLGDGEQSAVGRAYAVSNEWMNLDVADENGNVYIDDVGLRNNGYLVYDVPFYRFWTNIGSDADTSRAATVVYQDDGVRTLRTYVDAAAIIVSRKLGASYPMVYLSGSLLMGILALTALGIVLARCTRESMRIRIGAIAGLPSLLSVLVLHSGLAGLFRSPDTAVPWLVPDEILRRVILYVTPTDGKAYLITWGPILIWGMFLWNDLHKKTMPEQREKALFVGMVIASTVTALLRLQM